MSDDQGLKSDTPNPDRITPDDLMAQAEAVIDRLPTERLGELITYIQQQQRSRQDEERTRLLEQWREEAARLGYQVRLEPIGAPSGRRRQSSGKTIAPKYRGPNGETWSGRGIPPKWLTALEATGRNREEFKITEQKSGWAGSPL
jgi:DNA-binding protein H-NS